MLAAFQILVLLIFFAMCIWLASNISMHDTHISSSGKPALETGVFRPSPFSNVGGLK